MANINSYIQNIFSASRGEEVRDSICNAIQAINTDVETIIGLPSVSAADTGKILKVDSNGEWDKAESRLPAAAVSDAGKILKVNNEGAWEKAESRLPAATVSDAGKFLRVDSQGNIVLESLADAEEVGF